MVENQSGEFTRDELFRGLFNSAQQLVSPLANRLLDQSTANRNALNESIDYDRLNGSGPNDPEMAERTPQTYNEMLFGNANTNAPRPNYTPILIGAGVLAVVLLAVKGKF